VLDDRIQGVQAPRVGFDRALCTWPATDVGAWGAPRVPFPVVVPYRPRPDLARLGNEVHGRREWRVLDADADAPATLRAKRARLAAVPGRCVAVVPELAASPAAVWRRVARAAGAIADADRTARDRATREGSAREGTAAECASPDRSGAFDVGDAASAVSPLLRAGGELHAPVAGWAMPADPAAPFALRALRDDAVPVLEWIASRPPAERPLHALGLALQEDLAWMEGDAPGGAARPVMLHVCFPSGWAPERKIGLDFAAVHAPVPEADRVRASARALSHALTTQGPFVRFVWSLAPSGVRSRHPDDAPPVRDDAGGPWFRCERQVSLPVPAAEGGAASAVFLIRLHVAPLATVASEPARLAVVRDALASMSDATLRYKGLAEDREAWLAWIDAWRGRRG
jgi:hypothetical protein